MSLLNDHGDIILKCDGRDGKTCSEKLDTKTSNFESARNCWRRHHWAARKNRDTDEWVNQCPKCQGSLL